MGKAVLHRMQWRRQWQPTPVLLPGESHGWRSLVGRGPWGRRELDTTEVTKHSIGCKRKTILFLFFPHCPFKPDLQFSFPFFLVAVLTRSQKTFQALLNYKKSTSHFQPKDTQLKFAIQFYSQHGNTKI